MTVLAELLAGRLPDLNTLPELVATNAVKPRDTVGHDLKAPQVTNWVALVESAVYTECIGCILKPRGWSCSAVLAICDPRYVFGEFVCASQAQTVLADTDLVCKTTLCGLEREKLLVRGRIEAVVEVTVDEPKG